MINVVHIHNADGNSFNVSLWEQGIVVNFKTYWKAKQFALDLAYHYQTYVVSIYGRKYFTYTQARYEYEDAYAGL